MNIYVANCTKQIQEFVYRVPEARGARVQKIPIGGQVKLSGDFVPAGVDSIVAQADKYGFVRVDAIDRTKAFVGLCYSVDKPVPVEAIQVAIKRNDGVLEERGRENRLEAAIAVNNALEEQHENYLKLDMEVVEENQDKHEGDGAVVAEGVTVDRTAEETGPRKVQTNKRRGR